MNWYKNFFDRNGFTNDHIDFSRWVSKSEGSHKNLLKKFGSSYLQRDFIIDGSPVVSNHDILDIAESIKSIIPQYFKNYGLSPIDIVSPTIRRGDHNIIKTSKHLCSFVRSEEAYGHLSKSQVFAINKYIADLGKHWKSNKLQHGSYTVTMCFDPKSFLLLGHYGPDSSSCFRQMSSSELHKFCIGQTENTFVILIRNNNTDTFPPNKNHARIWGHLNTNDDIWNFCNLYLCENIQEDTVKYLLLQFVQSIDQEFKILLSNKFSLDTTKITKNQFGTYSISKFAPIKNQILEMDLSDIMPYVCKLCHSNLGFKKDVVSDENPTICKKCFNKQYLNPLTEIDFKSMINRPVEFRAGWAVSTPTIKL